jgi:hypothetical protein
VARLLGADPKRRLDDDLVRMKPLGTSITRRIAGIHRLFGGGHGQPRRRPCCLGATTASTGATGIRTATASQAGPNIGLELLLRPAPATS